MLWKQPPPPHFFAEGSEWIKNKVFSLVVPGFLQMSEVKCVAECAVELESVWTDEVWDCIHCYDQSTESSKGRQQHWTS